MFHGLAGFIFGSNKPPSSDSDPAGQENCCDVDTSLPKNENVEIIDGEDEWLLVGVQQGEDAPPKQAAVDCNPVELDLLPLSDASSGESSPSADERGWNLTPPPCFTASFQREKCAEVEQLPFFGDENQSKAKPAACAAKIKAEERGDEEIVLNAVLETSNFENLLIEHPSMSVYGRISHELPRRLPSIAVAQGFRQSEKLPTAPAPEGKPVESTRAVDRRPVVNVAEALFDSELSTASSQAALAKQQDAERARQKKEFGSNRTRRLNAVAFIPPQGNATPRKRRMKNHHAGRCNDRKCQ